MIYNRIKIVIVENQRSNKWLAEKLNVAIGTV